MNKGWNQNEILKPRGAWTSRSLQTKNIPSRSSISQNMRFFPDYCYSREGTSNISIGSFTTSTGKVTGMFNWIAPSNNFLIYQDGSNIKRLNVATGAVSTLVAAGGSARYPSVADLGPRVYACSADTGGNGQILPIVHDGASATDNCFRGPITTTTHTAADGGGGGLCTIGTHKLAFLYTTRNGFTGQPNPISGGVFSPVSVTLAAGLHSITYNIAFNGLSDGGGAAVIIPIMTRADNLNNWFILPPGAYTGTVAVGTVNFSTTLTINISDEDLAQQTSALPYFDYLVQNGVGTVAPPNPDFIFAYGKRMCYGSGNTLYASDINNPQGITADLNIVPNPSQRRFKAGFCIGQQAYIGADKWTASVRDNGDNPSTWATPTVISDAKGPAFPNCVESKTLGQYAWIATEFGVEFFNGAYQDKPITYLCTDQWKRVNWNAAYAIQLADDTTNLKLWVAVPLDSNTECSHVFVIDYTNGLTWDTCDISIDVYGFGNFSSIRSVKEAATTNKTTIWIGPQAAGPLMHIDSTTHQDAGATVINAIWKSGYCRRSGSIASPLIKVGSSHVWAEGSGTLLNTWASLDGVTTESPQLLTPGAVSGQIPLGSTPDGEYYVNGDLAHVENYTVQFQVNSLGDFFVLKGFRMYEKSDLYTR